MQPKSIEKKRAIELRREGKTYREILAEIPVAKSTVSLWLREVHLAKRQIHRLTEKKRLAQLRGAAARHAQRIELTRNILSKSRNEIGKLSARDRWLIGIVMYWAEGTKEKSYGSANGVDFSNTDPLMVSFFVKWLLESCGIPAEDIYANLYIHAYQKDRVSVAHKYWVEKSGLTAAQLSAVYFKRHNPKTKRHNYNEEYYGTLRVRVRRSSALMRRIQGWVEGICA